jgi:hypothetical protein
MVQTFGTVSEGSGSKTGRGRKPFRPPDTDVMLILPADKARELGVKEIPLLPVLAQMLNWPMAE